MHYIGAMSDKDGKVSHKGHARIGWLRAFRIGVCTAAAFVCAVLPPASAADVAPLPLSHCTFQRIAEQLKGTCGKLFDQNPFMTLAPATAIKSGTWRLGVRPQSVWAGSMTDEGYPDATLELEIYADDTGVLRTEYGWFPVTHFVSSPALTFDLDGSHEIAPNALDENIVRRAAAILSTVSAWNRADNRVCPDGATTWSIYCAMRKATIEETGAFHHRRPALEAVRKVIDERAAGRNYDHRAMDYNNDVRTQLGDVQSLFAEALTGMKNPNWLATHWFAALGPQ